MIDIALYRARIGNINIPKRKTKNLDVKKSFPVGSLLDNDWYQNIQPLFVIFLLCIVHLIAFSLMMLCDTPRVTAQHQPLLYTESPLDFVANIKLWYNILLSFIILKYYRGSVIKFRKRHLKVLSYCGGLFSLLNFILITIVNPSLLNPGPNNNFHVYYQNVQGFIPIKDLTNSNPTLNYTKLLEFQNYVNSTKPSIIALNETWLKPSIRDNEILPDSNYKVFRVDRSSMSHPPNPNADNMFKRNGGGVLLAIRVDMEASSSIVKLKCRAEILTIKVSVRDKNFYFCTCYRVNNLGSLNHDEISTYLNSLYGLNKKFTKVFFVGDINLSNSNWSTCSSSKHIEQQFLDTFSNLGMVQLITEPTHRVGNMLDVLLTNCPQLVTNIVVLGDNLPVSSDHFPITFDICLNVIKKKPVKRTIFNFKKAKWDELNKDLKDTNWDRILCDIGPEDAWSVFKSRLNELSLKYIPKIKVSSEFQPPWFDSECHNLCRKKERLHSRFKTTRKDEHYMKYSRCRRQFQILVRSKMRDNLINIDGDPSLIPKKFWSHVKSSSNSHRIPERLNYGIRFRSNRQEQCELFNNFFHHQFSSPSSYDINIDYLRDPFSHYNILPSNVYRILSNIKTNKAQGPDNIHGKILKECSSSLAYPLSFLFNVCFSHGQLPDEWKLANVVPIHKKGSKTDVTNYRPISLTSLIMKSFERIIRDELYKSCEQLIDGRQHGFLPKRSCTTQMIDYCDSLALSLNSCLDTDVVYFDFSKAFDTVNHDILLDKLKYKFNIDGKLLRFLVCYLKGRKQRVVIGNCQSTLLDVNSGVPQGSILGPLLFALFINDLPSGLSPETSLAMYADDTKIWRKIHSIDDCYVLQTDINYMLNWASLNKMRFHPNKCEVLQVSLNRTCTSSLFSSLPFSTFFYTLGDSILDYVSSEKDLGVCVTKNLNWNEHCNNICTKARQMFGLTRRTAHFVNNPRQLRALYLSMVRSQFEHCSVVWRPPQKTMMDKFECLQKRCIKWIFNEEYLHYSKEMYYLKCRNLDILPILFRFDLCDLVMFHKVFYQLCPVSFPSYLKPFSGSSLRSCHLDDLCLTSEIIPTNSSSDTSFHPFTSSFFYRTFLAWNNLPRDVRSISCPRLFKHSITQILWNRSKEHFMPNHDSDSDSYENSMYESDEGG